VEQLLRGRAGRFVGRPEAVGLGVTEFKNGDEVYGLTNPQFYGANSSMEQTQSTRLL
jgi:NADPH:quinone reductase-like Zn-dependent oxidoreductase